SFKMSILSKAKKINLVELYADSCHLSSIFCEKFQELFPQLKKVGFIKCESEIHKTGESKVKLISGVTVRLLENIRKIKTMEWIRIQEMYWPSEKESPETNNEIPGTSSQTKRILRNCTPIRENEITSLKKFFESASLPPNSTNFLLEKKSEAWQGTDYDEVDDE